MPPKRLRLLDGAFGTFLSDQGFELCAPLWSARACLDAPERVVELHRAYAQAGANLLSAGTFGVHLDNCDAKTRAAIFARALESCESTIREFPSVAAYWAPISARADLDATSRADTYKTIATELVHAGAPAIILEACTSIADAEIFLAATRHLAIRRHIGFVPDLAGGKLASGESFARFLPLQATERQNHGGDFLCALHCFATDGLRELASSIAALGPQAELAIYPHASTTLPDGTWVTSGVGSEAFSDALVQLADDIALSEIDTIYLGGCCGSTPAHIAALAKKLA